MRQRELHRSLALLVRRQFFLEGLYATRDRVKADVICVAGEMDEMAAVEVEGWHFVADELGCAGAAALMIARISARAFCVLSGNSAM